MQRAKQISESLELGIILALAGGFMDVYSYIGRDHVFANAQTGNILLVGVSISEGNWALAGRYFFPVVSFAVGIMLADLVHERFGSVIHWRQVTVFFEAVILLGVSFIPGGGYNLLANCLTSFACGMQVESFRKIHGHGIATTMCIGNLRNALQNVDDYIITHRRGFLENGLLYFGVIFTVCVWRRVGATGVLSAWACTPSSWRACCCLSRLPSCSSTASATCAYAGKVRPRLGKRAVESNRMRQRGCSFAAIFFIIC